MSNSKRIRIWRSANPGIALTERVLCEILGVETLRGVDLAGADLSEANLNGAGLTRVNLDGADLTKADLTDANLAWANLSWATLDEANLDGANLSGADLIWVNLSDVDLTDACLDGANLPPEYGLTFDTPSGTGWLVRTLDGEWEVTIGCWTRRTLDDLEDLVEDRVEWPEATGDERERRRPYLRGVLITCQAHVKYYG